MLRDITLGQYYQTKSYIHDLDPRVKLGGTVLYIISLFCFKNYLGYLIAALFLALVVKLSHVPFRFMVKGMKAILMLLMITVMFNLFLTPGTPVVTLWKLTITAEGVRMALTMMARLTLLVIGSSLMTLTTTPNNLTDGMEKMMSPLKVIKVPVHEGSDGSDHDGSSDSSGNRFFPDDTDHHPQQPDRWYGEDDESLKGD